MDRAQCTGTAGIPTVWPGFIIDLPAKDRADLARMRAIIESEPSSDVSQALVAKLNPDLEQVVDNSKQFGPKLSEGIEFLKVAFLGLALLCIGIMGATIILLRKSVLPPLQSAIGLATAIRARDLTSDRNGIWP